MFLPAQHKTTSSSISYRVFSYCCSSGDPLAPTKQPNNACTENMWMQHLLMTLSQPPVHSSFSNSSPCRRAGKGNKRNTGDPSVFFLWVPPDQGTRLSFAGELQSLMQHFVEWLYEQLFSIPSCCRSTQCQGAPGEAVTADIQAAPLSCNCSVGSDALVNAVKRDPGRHIMKSYLIFQGSLFCCISNFLQH